jgi:hypothetical protein
MIPPRPAAAFAHGAAAAVLTAAAAGGTLMITFGELAAGLCALLSGAVLAACWIVTTWIRRGPPTAETRYQIARSTRVCLCVALVFLLFLSTLCTIRGQVTAAAWSFIGFTAVATGWWLFTSCRRPDHDDLPGFGLRDRCRFWRLAWSTRRRVAAEESHDRQG